MSERMEFQTEAKEMLQLMIHSLYSHKEIFLRELISNASDALDKLRFEALTNDKIVCEPEDLKIRLSVDKEAKRITLTDNGIGMDKDELINNLGTIARSGSKAFLENLSGDQKEDSNLIGQFGVGFYSVFMVADKIEVLTKRAGQEQAYRWTSEGDTSFEIDEASRAENGTDIIIYVNEGGEEYLEDWTLKSLIRKHSNFVAFPVQMQEEVASEGPKKDDEDAPKKLEWKTVNNTKPLWVRTASEVTEEEYEEFFTGACGGFGKPMKTIHTKAEGVTEYSAIAFLPEKLSPYEMYNVERKHGMKLYVKRVFISDDIKELVPSYFRFVKGVVDSEDLPLNVSREILQDNPLIGKIKKGLTSKIFTELKKMAKKKPEAYAEFWKEFGQIIKEGLHSDFENRDKLLELVRINSTEGDSAEYLTSFADYVSRMKEEQKHIYYIMGENYDAVKNSPHLEVFKKKGIEVLLLSDPIDQFVIPQLMNFDEKELKDVASGDLDLGDLDSDEDKKEQKKEEKRLKKFVGRVKNMLAEKVSDVRLTSRLAESPSCLVTGEGAMNPQMEQMMKAMGQEVPVSKRVLELNSNHDVVNKLNDLYEADSKNPELEEWVALLYDQALIAEGHMVEDQAAYIARVNKLFVKAVG